MTTVSRGNDPGPQLPPPRIMEKTDAKSNQTLHLNY